MKIIDLIKSRELTLSFEVFPPKKEASYESVRIATEEIAALHPSFMSVTYGVGGGTSNYTIDIARNIQEKYSVPMMAHLTCISSTKDIVAEQIRRIHAAGIENVMALRGDIPADMTEEDRSSWDYQHAVQLVRELRESGHDFCIGAACYPEIHPESTSSVEDILHLKEKVDAGTDFLTTQMVFDNDLFFHFLYQLRERGISVPVVPGVMPITTSKQIFKAIRLSSAYIPRRFKAASDRFGEDPEAMKQAGIMYAVDQIIDLYANGIRHVHVYSMNKPDVAEGILNCLQGILGKTVRHS